MRKIAALVATRWDALSHRIQWDLSKHDDIRLLRGAGNEREAIELVRLWSPDVVLLDLVSFGAHEMDLLQRMTACSPETKVLLLYAERTPERVIDTIQRGGFGCLRTGYRDGE